MWDKKVRQHFDRLAPVYDEHKESYYYSIVEKVVRKFLPSSRFVLDLGCGSGKLLRDLFPRGVGVDLSSRLLEIACNKRTNHDYVVADAKHLPFRGARFPAVVCIDLLEHINNTEQLLDEVQRVAEIGGIVVITVVRSFFWPLLEILEMFRLKLPEGPHEWIHARSVVTLLNKRGFHCSITNYYFGLMQAIVAYKQNTLERAHT